MKSFYTSLAVICLILGIMVSAQYKSNQSSPTYFSPDRWAEVAIQTEHLKNQHDALVNETVSLRYKLVNTDAAAKAQAVEEMLDKANIAAGVTPVTGPGIVLILDDRADPSQEDNTSNFALQYWSLLPIINELNAAGAESISINGERIIASSEISNQGTSILVNRNTIASPYEIRAIGDAKTLESSLNLKGGELQALIISGTKVNIRKSEKVEIPAYAEDLAFRYAKPVQVD